MIKITYSFKILFDSICHPDWLIILLHQSNEKITQYYAINEARPIISISAFPIIISSSKIFFLSKGNSKLADKFEEHLSLEILSVPKRHGRYFQIEWASVQWSAIHHNILGSLANVCPSSPVISQIAVANKLIITHLDWTKQTQTKGRRSW